MPKTGGVRHSIEVKIVPTGLASDIVSEATQESFEFVLTLL